ncbi:hypothetical protein [Devosia aquimaris]|uniref:hypothetical protein n=1 Tax=Devosia aquimaris TaxID=2866214 RepID=UPI001CD109D4|nr:hypothetical protein [Devosia sp. CJK-A8-3]
MAYDDIIIGSGLSGLAVAMGLDPSRRILVLTEPEPATVRYYDQQTNVPSGVRGPGGLGNFWHGVIPFADDVPFAPDCRSAFETLFAHFYPGVDIDGRYGSRWLFVPRQPIRPRPHWARLVADRGDRLQLRPLAAERFDTLGSAVTVRAGSETLSAARLWICAGALDTPALIARSLGPVPGLRHTASDHVICYLGQVRASDEPQSGAVRVDVERTATGYWFAALPQSSPAALVTAKPARFSYRRLDHGIEQRAAFGLPAGGVVAKVMRARSLGLISEALFNKAGLFPHASVNSLYAQIPVSQAYDLELETGRLAPRLQHILATTDAVRENLQIPGMRSSQRPELFIRGIHLHDTLDAAAMAAHDINTEHARIRICDASVIGRIGGEHHSFHMMAKAFKAARQV